MVVSFVLSNSVLPSLPTLSKLHSTSINTFFDKDLFNTTKVTLFLKTAFPLTKIFFPDDKPVYRLLRNTSYMCDFIRIKGDAIPLIIFYANVSCHMVIFILHHQLML